MLEAVIDYLEAVQINKQNSIYISPLTFCTSFFNVNILNKKRPVGQSGKLVIKSLFLKLLISYPGLNYPVPAPVSNKADNYHSAHPETPM